MFEGRAFQTGNSQCEVPKRRGACEHKEPQRGQLGCLKERVKKGRAAGHRDVVAGGWVMQGRCRDLKGSHGRASGGGGHDLILFFNKIPLAGC